MTTACCRFGIQSIGVCSGLFLPSSVYKAEFGVDLTEEVEGFNALLENEKVFTSRDGDLILFDNEGIHRGGRVKQGTRVILQISLYIKVPKLKPIHEEFS